MYDGDTELQYIAIYQVKVHVRKGRTMLMNENKINHKYISGETSVEFPESKL